MKVVMISDTHGFHRDPHLIIPDGDLLIHAGDMSMMGELDVLLDVNDWFKELDFNDIVVIAGNHDRSLGGKAMMGYKMFTNAIYLDRSSVMINDKLIWGSPYTTWSDALNPMFKKITYIKDEMDWAGIPKDVDILVTHQPPYGFGDLLDDYGSEPNTHIGDMKLYSKILDYKPELNVTGHIHEAYGVYHNDDTTIVNASVVDPRYNLVNKPVVIDL